MDDDEEMWTSPVATPAPRSRTAQHQQQQQQPKTPVHGGGGGGGNNGDDTYDPDASLRKELAGVRSINEAVEAIIATLGRTQSNMNTVSSTIGDASTLLNTWTRILSQTEHNQRLILDTNWHGSTQDLAEVEAETLRQQQMAERRAYEEEQRRDEAAVARRRAAEEEDMRNRTGAAAGDARRRRGTGSVRGRSRGAVAGRGAAGRGVTRTGTSSAAGTASAGQTQQGEGGVVRSRSIIGRGVARYRPRGSRGAE